MRSRHGLASLLAMLIAGLAPVCAQAAALTPLAVDEFKKNDRGIIVAEVTFAEDGTVTNCRIVRSNAPFPLEVDVADYIRRKWVNEWFANDTVRFPITFDKLPWYAKHWDEALAPPPNFLPAGDAGRKLKLRISFGPDGWAQKVLIQAPSGVDSLDRDTAIWVQVHWHKQAFAGQTLDAPFEFKPPVAVHAKTPARSVAPDAEEIYAAPAQRVE